MFERFTEKAIKSIILAQEEARRVGHNYVGTEQMLLGLMGEGTGIAAKVLKSFSTNLKDMRLAVENVIGRGSGHVTVEMPFTPHARRGLELSWTIAREQRLNYIDTDHVLLGILKTEDEVLLKVLERLSLDSEQLCMRALEIAPEVRSKQRAGVDSVQAFSANAQTERREIKQRVACKNCGEPVSVRALRCRFCRIGLSDEHFKSCPICGESIRKAAIKCMHCQSSLSEV